MHTLILLAVVAVAAIPMKLAGRAGLCVLLLSLAVVPKTIVGSPIDRYVGISTHGVTFTDFTIMAIFIGSWAFANRTNEFARGVAIWTPLVITGALLYIFEWPHDSYVSSGVLHYVASIMIFCGGFALARHGDLSSEFIAKLTLVVLFIEMIFVASDEVGKPLHSPKGPQALELAGRAIGTTDHPDQLAKLVLLLLLFALQFPVSTSGWRNWSIFAVASCFVLLALTESRAALVGGIVGLAVFVATQPDRRLNRRPKIILAAAAVVVLINAGALIRRFQLDPAGGSRAHLSKMARRIIPEHLWQGLGPNEYVHRVGPVDALTASGVPVHNSFLLATAELGLVASVFFWAPLAVLVVRSWRARRSSGPSGAAARSILAIAPALFLVSYTGWGTLQSPTLELLFVGLGVSWGLIDRGEGGERHRASQKRQLAVGI